MQPVIPPQAGIVAHPLTAPPQIDDLYLYKSGDLMIVHRLMKIDADDSGLFYFKGDHPHCHPEPVQLHQILGRVHFDQVSHLKELLSRLHPDDSTYKSKKTGTCNPASSGITERNHKLMNQYQIITRSFNENQIRHTPIKGIWLLRQHPENLTTRMISDLDLLIDSEDLSKATAILTHLGYRQDTSKEWFNIHHTRFQSHHLRPFRLNDCSVEIHFLPFPGAPPVLARKLLETSRLEDHFLVLLFHFYRHLTRGDYREKWLADLLFLFPQVHQSDPPDHSSVSIHPYAMAVTDLWYILEAWLKHKPGELSGVAHQLSVYIHQSFNNFARSGNHFMSIKKYILHPANLMYTLLPKPAYLRFIYPAPKEKPLILLYLHRWKTLIYKTIRLLILPRS